MLCYNNGVFLARISMAGLEYHAGYLPMDGQTIQTGQTYSLQLLLLVSMLINPHGRF